MKVSASTVHPLPSTIIKMEDRKRAAGQSVDDLAPPTKRQALNGASKASADSDLPWKDDLEAFQKDAIYRQMQEYKREKNILESQIKEVQKRSVDHDDHLRVIDAWWSQLLEEVVLLSRNIAPSPSSFEVETPFPTALSFKNSSEFSDHLTKKGKDIKLKISELLKNISAATQDRPDADLQSLRDSMTALLAAQKEQMIKYDRLRQEREEIGERLETASLRYLRAEKKFERAKSDKVAKMEAQESGRSAKAASAAENGSDSRSDSLNGLKEEPGLAEANTSAMLELTAAFQKQTEQLQGLHAENKALTEQITTASIRLTNLTDDDYAKTELFKGFRKEHEEVIKRINHLEATNIQLREEAERLQAERTSFRTMTELESDNVIGELESQVQRLETDLTRIRSARDELVADQTTRRAHQDHEKEAIHQMKELVGAKEDRIAGLEFEIQRLKSESDESSCQPTPGPELENLGLEELKLKYRALERDFASVNNELPAMEKAWKRATAIASKKVMDFAALEDKVVMLIAEKSKADQKYFAARRDMENKQAEIHRLKAQNSQTSDRISQFKNSEIQSNALRIALEKQVSDLEKANTLLATENKRLGMSSADAISKMDALRTQISELTNIVKTKDAGNSVAKQHSHAVEVELEKLKVRYEQIQKEKDTWKAKSLKNTTAEEDDLRQLALCTVCKQNFRNRFIKSCGHTFCNKCVDDRIANRLRKCPSCGKAFDKSDVHVMHIA